MTSLDLLSSLVAYSDSDDSTPPASPWHPTQGNSFLLLLHFPLNPSHHTNDPEPGSSHHPPVKMNKNLEKYYAMGKELYYGSKAVLRGRVFHSEVRGLPLLKQVCQQLASQGWLHLFLDTDLVVHEPEVVEFSVNLTILEGNLATSRVKEVEMIFDKVKLGEILTEVAELKDQLADSLAENRLLKDKLIQQQHDHIARIDRLLQLFSPSQSPHFP